MVDDNLRGARRLPEPGPDASEDEIADWFATTDLSTVELELIERTPGAARPPGLQTVAIRLPGWEIEEIKHRAERRGIGYTTYIRMLIHRHVIEEAPID